MKAIRYLCAYLIVLTPIGGLTLAIIQSKPEIFYNAMLATCIGFFLTVAFEIW
jgi:hypothetical protein